VVLEEFKFSSPDSKAANHRQQETRGTKAFPPFGVR
jgi:hypothetical protein